MVEEMEKLLGSSTMISVFVGMARVQDARTAMATAHLIEDDIIWFDLRGAWMMRVRFWAGSWKSLFREGHAACLGALTFFVCGSWKNRGSAFLKRKVPKMNLST
jgi:hypothetical protein